MFGYFANATKTWLVTKEKYLATAAATFANTGVQITSEGRPYLEAAICTEEFVISYVKVRVAKLTKVLDSLAAIALTQPHAAYAALTHGFSNKCCYLTCAIHGIDTILQQLETTIRLKLIPTLILVNHLLVIKCMTYWLYLPD